MLHGRYPSELEKEEIDVEGSLRWLTDGFLSPETERFFKAMQDEVIGTTNYRNYITKDTIVRDNKCRLCGKESETVEHLIGGCSGLVAGDYKARHNSTAKVIHAAVIRKYFSKQEMESYHKYKPPKTRENEEALIYWDGTQYTLKPSPVTDLI